MCWLDCNKGDIMGEQKTIEYVYADLDIMVTLSENKSCILASMTHQEVQVLANAIYLTLTTFTTTRALYSLQNLIEKQAKDKDITEDNDNEHL